MERVSSIAQRLKEYRDRFSLTLAEVSQKCNVPTQTLNRYELGQRIPKIDTAVEIAELRKMQNKKRPTAATVRR